MSSTKIERPPEETVSVDRLSLPLIVALGLAAAAASGIAAYTTAMGEMSKEFVQVRLESEQKFVKQEDLHEAVTELRSMNGRLSNIEGFMRSQEHRRNSGGP